MQSKKKVEKPRKTEQEKFAEEIVADVVSDFERRKKERAAIERQWELNMNFLVGNQYCKINRRGEIDQADADFYWQEREVFNHIAPIIETRLAKFSRIKPSVFIRPKSDDDKDVISGSISEKLIAESFKTNNIEQVVKKVTVWSETCGTGFYKIVWDNEGGNEIGVLDGKKVFEGDVEVLPVSPFEIFPDSLNVEELQDCGSIIHARAMKVDKVYEKYGVRLAGEEIGIFNLSQNGIYLNKENKDSLSDAVVVIEKYEKPTKDFPNGRLITVAGDKLLYYGELPYVNGDSGKREYPFVKQESTVNCGNFFGNSIIERLIPIQRAFNAVKNRKHEFLNRISLGVMTVEDGSVDVDDLSEEGISPGKIIVYRQGSKAPEFMSDVNMPNGFTDEEEKLINEFVIVSGVSDVSSSAHNASLSSGSALEILIEQDNERLIMSAETIRRCYLKIAKQIIKLYAQFSVGVRAVRFLDGLNKTRLCYADKSNINADDVYLENENELLYSESQKKEMVFKLYDSGLLLDGEGKLRSETKEKVLSLLGYKDLDYQKGISKLQEEKAQRENEILRKDKVDIEEIDDDGIHIDEHTRYVLSEYSELGDVAKERFFSHIKAHKERQNQLKGE